MTIHTPTDSLPEWRLDDLYAGLDDPRIEADLQAAVAANAALNELKGKLVVARRDPQRLGALLAHAIDLYEQATNALWSVGAYAGLMTSTSREDSAWAKFESDMRARSSAIAADSLFLTLELNQLDEAEIETALRTDPAAAKWRPWLRRVRLMREHELSGELERLFNDRAPGIANWVRLYDETLSRMQVKAGRETLSLPEALNRLSDPSPAQRKLAAQGLAKALQDNTPVLALCLNTIAFEKQVEDRWRKFADPAASRHLANEVDADAVDALDEAVAEHYPRLSHRYYALKAKALGRRQLDYWDRNAPLDEAPPRRYSWEEAKALVLESFEQLAPAFADKARTFFEQPWIDARPRAGKSSGAYSHPVTANRHPYVFLNYMGERRDVLTLAHELGHAVHQTLAAPLGTLLADTPLTLAETASIFGEGLVFDRLLVDASRAERRALLAGKIEDGLNTVVRQIAFHRFEKRFHAARAAGELAPDHICGLWLEVMSESLGPAIKLNPGYEHYWAYVSHFVHSPFYVYAYAFGDLLVEALMEKRLEDPVGFAPKYEALLAGGGAQTYVEALAPFGLNPREKAFWEKGLGRLERLIDEFEALGVSETACVYGAPPASLADTPTGAIQVSPLVPGAARLGDIPPESLAQAVIAAPPGAAERRYVLALALRALKPGAPLIALAPKDKGGARLRKELEGFGCAVEDTGRQHHRICHTARPHELMNLDAAIEAGAPRFVEALGLWTQPGLFSWDRPDPGSLLLISALPALAGRGADLGCGAGLIGRAVLTHPAVTHLDLIDIDRRAIEAARRNIEDARAALHWADVRTAPELKDLDFVVMNPPFHDGGHEEKRLGQAFIRRAHQALRKGGKLCLVANRHLPYEGVLAELFAKVELKAEAKGFKVYEARR